MLRILPLLFAAMLYVPAHANATDGFASGGELQQWCQNMDNDDIHWGLCVGSITAAHDTAMTFEAALGTEPLICTTMNHTRGDVVFAVIEYLNTHPSRLDESLGDVVLAALMDKFPCP